MTFFQYDYYNPPSTCKLHQIVQAFVTQKKLIRKETAICHGKIAFLAYERVILNKKTKSYFEEN
jgi:hypothetical protein